MPEKTRYPKPFDYFPKNGGSWFLRSIYQSPAYCKLSSNGKTVLIAALDARQFDKFKDRKTGKKKRVLTNGDAIRLPYRMLMQTYFLNMAGCTRGIDDCLSKGFLRIVHVGGGGKGDMTVYALSEDYLRWAPGVVFHHRPEVVRRGFQQKRVVNE
jgi:hypothetical protein